MNGQTESRARGWTTWVRGVALIGLCLQLGLGTLPTLHAAWALLFTSAALAITGTACYWPRRTTTGAAIG